MTTEDDDRDRVALSALPGGQELCDWFGSEPGFHDATLSELTLRQPGVSTLRFDAFRVTSEIDANGYYVCDRHVIVTFALERLIEVNLTNFMGDAAIVTDLKFADTPGGVRLSWGSAYGVDGSIEAHSIQVDFEPISNVAS
jgi:hypothetical protein